LWSILHYKGWFIDQLENWPK